MRIYAKHVQIHAAKLNSDINLCPVPSCGTKSFSERELLEHMVAFHRVPVCGSTGHILVKRLRLPGVEENEPSKEQEEIPQSTRTANDAGESDQNNDPDGFDENTNPASRADKGKNRQVSPTATNAENDHDESDENTDTASKKGKKRKISSTENDTAGPSTTVTNGKRLRPAELVVVKWHCFGCRRDISKLEAHFDGSKLGSKCRKGRYARLVNGKRQEELQYPFSKVRPFPLRYSPPCSDITQNISLAGSSAKPRGVDDLKPYYCCRRGIWNIQQHRKDDGCNEKKFKMDPFKGRTRTEYETTVVYAEWVKTAPPYIPPKLSALMAKKAVANDLDV